MLALLAAGCGSADDLPPVSPKAERGEADAPKRPRGTLYRDEVDRMVEGGLGRFLQRVDVEAALDNGRFKGFRIMALGPPEFWEGVDLKPGDVVTSVNGMPIERETQAYDAFTSLRKASRLEVSYLRGGQPRTLVYKIVPRTK